MKTKIFLSVILMVLLVPVSVSGFQITPWNMEFARTSYNTHVKLLREAAERQTDNVSIYYIVATGVGTYEGIPVIYLIETDYANKTCTIDGYGYKLSEDDSRFGWSKHEIPVPYTNVSFKLAGGELYLVCNLGDGRGDVAQRVKKFGYDLVDLGSYNRLNSIPGQFTDVTMYPVSDLYALNAVYGI